MRLSKRELRTFRKLLGNPTKVNRRICDKALFDLVEYIKNLKKIK